MDAYEAVMRRAGARQLGVMADNPSADKFFIQMPSGGGGGQATGGVMILSSTPYTRYGAGPAPKPPALKPSSFVGDESLSDATKRICGPRPTSPGQPAAPPNRANYPANMGGTAQYNGAVAQYNALMSNYRQYLGNLARWEACAAKVMKDWNSEGRQAEASPAWPLAAQQAQTYIPIRTLQVASLTSAQTASTPSVTASGFQMNATPMDFTHWLTLQQKHA
jgi:hypothetical protein